MINILTSEAVDQDDGAPAASEYGGHPRSPGSRLRRQVRAEARRIFSTRGWLILLAVAVALPATGTLATGLTAGRRGGVDPTTAAGIRTVLASGFTSALLATLLGALAVTTEFRHRTASASIIATGSRSRWALSKVLVAAPLGLVFTLVGQATVLAIGLPLLADKGVHPDVWSGDLLAMSLGTVTLGAFAAAWGVGIGLCLRNQLATVAGIVIYTTMAEAAFLQYVPSVGKYLPGGAQAAIGVDQTLEHLPMAAGYLVFTIWIAASLLLGRWLLLRRDLPV